MERTEKSRVLLQASLGVPMSAIEGAAEGLGRAAANYRYGSWSCNNAVARSATIDALTVIAAV
jgi:hypothetical protein